MAESLPWARETYKTLHCCLRDAQDTKRPAVLRRPARFFAVVADQAAAA